MSRFPQEYSGTRPGTPPGSKLRNTGSGTRMHPVVQKHRKELKALASRYGLRSVHVFGSMARGDADMNSDVDLLVDAPPGTSAFVLGAMLMDAQDLLGRRVDIVTRSALNPALRERVLCEAELL
jgi:uncharacterized protein